MAVLRGIRGLLVSIGVVLPCLISLSTWGAPRGNAGELTRFDIEVAFSPVEHGIKGKVSVGLPQSAAGEVRFLLHKDLDPVVITPGAAIVGESPVEESSWLRSYRVSVPVGVKEIAMRYTGRIYHPLDAYGQELSRGVRSSPGLILEEGIYLAGESGWYPRFDEGFLTFRLNVVLPDAWDAISQGERTSHSSQDSIKRVTWECAKPQQEIYLIAGRFVEYSRKSAGISSLVYLRRADEPLAQRYLFATERYIDLYQRLIGTYPYGKFAAIENFWETGFGMPSFTLLGSKVMRFPFILHTSYPHEILHNWWGNSVYPDYPKGNWCEGLTAYLSDHLFKEMRGKAADYRRDVLQKYADFVSAERDFPLIRFRSRHDAATAAVGYGKALMFFHMLRLELGDRIFKRGLRDFYRKNQFRLATYDDLRTSFERVSNEALKEEFDQWVTRSGAPKIAIRDVRTVADSSGYAVAGTLEQTQPGEPYKVAVPLAVTLWGQDDVFEATVHMSEKSRTFRLPVAYRPVRIDVDARFDLFRKLDKDEVAPALSEIFGAKRLVIVLPGSAREEMKQAYRTLARSLSAAASGIADVTLDSDLAELPDGSSAVILGWDNRFRDWVARAFSPYGSSLENEAVRIGDRQIARQDHCIVVTARNPSKKAEGLCWIGMDNPRAAHGLGRKLPHYSSYSYLAFQGAEPTNVLKGRWPVINSPMTVVLPVGDASPATVKMGRLPERAPLAVMNARPRSSGPAFSALQRH